MPVPAMSVRIPDSCVHLDVGGTVAQQGRPYICVRCSQGLEEAHSFLQAFHRTTDRIYVKSDEEKYGQNIVCLKSHVLPQLPDFAV